MMRINQQYSRIHQQIPIMRQHLTANAERLAIPAGQIAEFNRMSDDFLAKWAVYIDPNSHTAIAVHEIRQISHEIWAFMQAIRQQIKANAYIDKIGDDYANLFIHENRARRHQVPKPDMTPAAIVTARLNLVATIGVFIATDTHKHMKIPKDVREIGRALAVTNSQKPAADTIFRELESSTRARFNLRFAAADVGRFAHLKLCYINPRGQRGPISKPLSFAIV